ncbi:hypothetical protein Droror1_Dr00015233 [Drosera rotundifolia]
MDINNQSSSSFKQFSDQLRLQSTKFSNLSLNDSIWSIHSATNNKNPEDRVNFDIHIDDNVNNLNNNLSNIDDDFVNDLLKPDLGFLDRRDYNSYTNVTPKPINHHHYKIGSVSNEKGEAGLNGGFNKGLYRNPMINHDHYNGANNGKGSANYKGYYKNFNGRMVENDDNGYGGKSYHNRKNKEMMKKDNGNKDENNNNKSLEKRFKCLPPSEALPRNETIGGYIFVCNNDTMEENLRRQLFGLPPRYRDSVRAITPGLPLFLYNYSTHQLHGIYEAASFGGTNIDSTAWEDKKNPSESRFPAQVKVQTRKICEPLEEDSFRPILHHYDGPKFRLELSVPEALSLLDIFEDNDA